MQQQPMPQSRRKEQQLGKLHSGQTQNGSRLRKRKAQGTVANLRDIDRRVDKLEQRIVWLDEHGTRGVQVLQVQITEQAKDITDNTARLAAISAQIDAQSSARRQQFVMIALSLLPIYVLLFLSLFHVSVA